MDGRRRGGDTAEARRTCATRRAGGKDVRRARGCPTAMHVVALPAFEAL